MPSGTGLGLVLLIICGTALINPPLHCCADDRSEHVCAKPSLQFHVDTHFEAQEVGLLCFKVSLSLSLSASA